MRQNRIKIVFRHAPAILLVLAMCAVAHAQTAWQPPPAAGADYNGGFSSPRLLPDPSADVPRPFDVMPGASPLVSHPAPDPSVIRTDYQTAAQPAAVRAPNHERILPRGDKSSRLLPRGAPSQAGRGGANGLNRVWTTGAALALVLGVFFVVAWIMRRAAPKTVLPLPHEVVETLGRAPLAGRQCVHLVRCGRKLLLVSVTPERATTLTEITDPLEVDRLTGLCDRSRGGSAAAAFRQVFEQFSHASRRPLSDDSQVAAHSYFDDDGPSFLEGRDG